MLDRETVRRERFGQFNVGDQSLFGELVLEGRRTNLRLYSQEYFSPDSVSERCIYGELSDNTKITLLDCNLPPIPGRQSSRQKESFFADIFPHHIAIGAEHLSPGPDAVSAIYWRVPDLNAVFYDFDAFGSSLRPEQYIDAILAERETVTGRKVHRGQYPEVLYFSGEPEIFSCDLGCGTLSAYHTYEQGMGGPNGVWLKNKVKLSLQFGRAESFTQALILSYRVSEFLGAVMGRPQSVEDIYVLPSKGVDQVPLQVLSSLPVRYETEAGVISPGPRDALLDGVDRPEEMAAVLGYWLDSHDAMSSARARFWDSFEKQNHFDADRIIAAANLFDVIPASHYPKKFDLSGDFEDAVKKAKALFKPLPDTPERHALLIALRNASTPNLKSKIKFWAKDLIDQHGSQYPDLEFVIDCAVNCRNFFVHGGKPEMDYVNADSIRTVAFLTRALEFCYILPEFLKAGWQWRGVDNHPFGEFTLHYPQDLERLKRALASGKA